MVAHWKGSLEHMLFNYLLALAVIVVWGLMWMLPYKKDIARWFDERWGR